MTKWLVISDNHGDRDILISLKAALRPDTIFHCGDSEMAADYPWFKDVYAVQGNMDFGSTLPMVETPLVDGQRILLTHGHHDDVNWDLTKLKLRADQEEAAFVFYGHTHQLAVDQVGGHIFVNPGSISQPRGEYERLGGTCALITLTDTAWTIQYYDRQAQPVSDLMFTFNHA